MLARGCIECEIIYGCRKTEDTREFFCETCTMKTCRIEKTRETIPISHGICRSCFAKAKLRLFLKKELAKKTGAA